jgi:SAM-dependent methyltransferase
MQSHRAVLGSLVVRLRWRLRHLVLGVLDRYFEKERLFLLELVRFENALAERSDRLLREVTERTKAVAERNDLFLGALDLRVEALEASEQMRREPPSASGHAAILAEMASAMEGDVAGRIRPFVERAGLHGTILVVGCGDGSVFAALPADSTASGIDVSAELVARSRARGYGAELASAEPYLCSRAERSLDGVVLTGLADRHTLAQWPALVTGAWNALRPGGVALFAGLRGDGDVRRLCWLLARNGFAITEAAPAAAPLPGEVDHVVVARRGDAG